MSVLSDAEQAGLEGTIVIGYDENGRSYFDTDIMDENELIGIMETVKHSVIYARFLPPEGKYDA